MADLKAAPALSTPAENLFDHVDTFAPDADAPRRTDDELRHVYEIERTAREIRAARKTRVALQFPDTMLGDSPRIVRLLEAELAAQPAAPPAVDDVKVYILADTSYSACCVDEVAAEHADADIVVHYGRSCLSPTSRLPVIYIFTQHALDTDDVVGMFTREFGTPGTAAGLKVVVMADVTYQDHVAPVAAKLAALGYADILSTAVDHRPLGAIPNRQLVRGTVRLADDAVDLHDYAVFHIAQPPTSLLLALAVRVQSFYIYPTCAADAGQLLAPRTMGLLGRRYAKVLTMATAGVIGILVNTLSVNNYLQAVDALRKRIAAAGKKSYLVVVGKLNAVKLANFSEIEGWVVVGCWESSLVEDDAGFYQPVVTPFELEMALTSDDKRIWGHKWWGGLEGLTADDAVDTAEDAKAESETETATVDAVDAGGVSDDEDTEIPQFDLRTGRLVTTSRPMRSRAPKAKTATVDTNGTASTPLAGALALRGTAALATINGVVSPGAEYLRKNRTWQGLGTEFNDDGVEASTAVEEGRSGIARGYHVGEDVQRT